MGPLSRFRRVVIPTPAGATGGPEAIHQLAYSLNSIGVDCRIAYYGEANAVKVTTDRITCTPPGHGPSTTTAQRPPEGMTRAATVPMRACTPPTCAVPEGPVV